MTIFGIDISVAAFVLILCGAALALLLRLRGTGPAVLVTMLLSVVGTVSFLATFAIPVA